MWDMEVASLLSPVTLDIGVAVLPQFGRLDEGLCEPRCHGWLYQ